MRTIARTLPLAALALALAACSTTSSTPTSEPQPAPEPIVDLADYDDALLLLDLTWQQQDAQARDDMCWGYDVLGADWIVTELNGSSPDPINPQAIRDHFRDAC